MAFARAEQRLFANYTVAIDMVDRAATIGNPPMPGHQLHGFVAAIFDADMVGPEPASLRGCGLFHQKVGRHADRNAVGRRTDRKEGIEDAAHKPAAFNA